MSAPQTPAVRPAGREWCPTHHSEAWKQDGPEHAGALSTRLGKGKHRSSNPFCFEDKSRARTPGIFYLQPKRARRNEDVAKAWSQSTDKTMTVLCLLVYIIHPPLCPSSASFLRKLNDQGVPWWLSTVLLWQGFHPRPWNFYMQWAWPKNNNNLKCTGESKLCPIYNSTSNQFFPLIVWTFWNIVLFGGWFESLDLLVVRRWLRCLSRGRGKGNWSLLLGGRIEG